LIPIIPPNKSGVYDSRVGVGGRHMDRLEKVRKLVKEWQSRPGDLDCGECSVLEEDCFNTLLEIAKVLGLDEVCECGAATDDCWLNREVFGVHLNHVDGE